MMLRYTFGLLIVGLSVGCGDDSSPNRDVFDATPDTDIEADTDTDTADTGIDPDTADTADTGIDPDTTDTGIDPDTTDTGINPDTTSPGPIAATPGARCAPGEQIGLVVIEDQGALYYASAYVYDRTNPVYGPPESTTDVCAFYRFIQGSAGCPTCAEDETCGRSGQCEKLPVIRRDVVLELAAGEATQRFESGPDYGELWGQLTLGRTTSLVLTFGDIEVTLPPTTIPDALEGVDGILAGDYDDPKGLDISWKPVVGDTQVFTHVPMNHHVAEPTFTQCATAASTGALQIGGDMLKPLSVSTGLEFQGIEHMRFAAADTAQGCVEIRYQNRAYVPLF